MCDLSEGIARLDTLRTHMNITSEAHQRLSTNYSQAQIFTNSRDCSNPGNEKNVHILLILADMPGHGEFDTKIYINKIRKYKYLYFYICLLYMIV